MRMRLVRGLIPALALAVLPAVSSAGIFVGVSVNLAPPPLPVYVQPPCPEPGYLWTPGYWGWNDGAYYWVPGTWVEPPEFGLLWTPGYWGWQSGMYLWHAGYWGPHVGFYGGVHYGWGYDGAGFDGGYWRGRVFMYNRDVVHVGPTFVTNVYARPAAYHAAYGHVSFNGGPGGVAAHATRAQMVAAHEHHFAYTSVQQRQQRMAFADHSLRADYNHGRPPIAATARPAVFHGGNTFAARAAGGPMHFAPVHGAAMRSDRPAWASGQNHAGRPMEHSASTHGHPGYARPEQQHFQSRPQGHAMESRPQGHSMMESRPQGHPMMARPEQQHFQSQPQGHAMESRPQGHSMMESRPQGHPMMARPEQYGRAPQGGAPRSAPHPQQQHGGGHRPPEGHQHR